jgi:hypothetical protein
MPIVALDYDDTFSNNPAAWAAVAAQLASHGYTVIGVTLRNRYMPVCDHYMSVCDAVVYCAGHAKKEVLARLGYQDVIWIDDNPKYIVRSYADVNGTRLHIPDAADDLYTPLVIRNSDPNYRIDLHFDKVGE